MKQIFARRYFIGAAIIFVGVLPVFANPYIIFVANLAMMYVLLAVGLNILLGYTGQLSFANAALFGVGAYTTGLLKLEFGLPFWLTLPAGAALATVAGVAVALPALRLSGLYLALATVAFAQFALWVFSHWNSVTYGGAGFRVPRVDFEPLTSNPEIGIYYVTLVIVIVAVALAWNMLRSRVGRAFVAIRESEVAAETLAIDLTKYKTIAYMVSALFAGTAGGLFSAMLGIVTPESYDLFQVIAHFAMVVVGGIGSIWGAVLGAGILIWLLETLRTFQELQEIAFGALLLFAVIVVPGGVISIVKRHLPGWNEPLRRTKGEN